MSSSFLRLLPGMLAGACRHSLGCGRKEPAQAGRFTGPAFARRAGRGCGRAGLSALAKDAGPACEIGGGRPPRGAARGLETRGRRFRPQQTRGNADKCGSGRNPTGGRRHGRRFSRTKRRHPACHRAMKMPGCLRLCQARIWILGLCRSIATAPGRRACRDFARGQDGLAEPASAAINGSIRVYRP